MVSSLFVFLCWITISVGGTPGCINDLQLDQWTNVSTSDDCMFRIDLDGTEILLWTVEIVAQSKVQAVILDKNMIAIQTVFSSSGEAIPELDTLCRPGKLGALDSIFYLSLVGRSNVDVSLRVSLLARSQLLANVPTDDTISLRPHYFYFLLPNGGTGGLQEKKKKKKRSFDKLFLKNR